MERVIALDLGEKRIGVAITDPLWITAQALPFIPNDEATFAKLQQLLTDYNCETLVIGLPKNREGGDSAKSLEVRAYAEKLQTQLNCTIEFWDERFSTVAVNRHLIAANIRRDARKQIVDSQAAMFILQGYMDKISTLRKNDAPTDF